MSDRRSLDKYGMSRDAEGGLQSPGSVEIGTPPYVQWARSFDYLLNDQDGVNLLKKFMKDEQCVPIIEFYFACQGLKKKEPSKVVQNVKIIFKTFINQNSAQRINLSEEVHKKIVQDFTSSKYDHIYDSAHAEVITFLQKTIYPNFLRSDRYIYYIQRHTSGASNSTHLFINRSGNNSIVGSTEGLAAVPENGELLEPPTIKKLTAESLHKRRKKPSTEMVPPAQARMLKNSMSSRNSHQVVNPYHVSYCPYVPTSAQDSERQSVSSGALTDDAMSIHEGTQKKLRSKFSEMKMAANKNKLPDHDEPFIPRPPHFPPDVSMSQNPAMFLDLLYLKLMKLKREQDREAGLINAVNNLSMINADDHQANSNLFSVNNNPYQLLLDKHISRTIVDCVPKDHAQSDSSFTRNKSMKDKMSASSLPENRPAGDGTHSTYSGSTINYPTMRKDQSLRKKKTSIHTDPPPSTISKDKTKMANLKHAFHKLQDDNVKTLKSKQDVAKKSGNSSSTGVSMDKAAPKEQTIVSFQFLNETDRYMTKMIGKNINLRQFKVAVNKSGNFRYFFKTKDEIFGAEYTMLEVSDDDEACPLWSGNIFATIRPAT